MNNLNGNNIIGQRLESVFNAVDGVPILGYDSNRRIILWNKACEKLTGYSSQEAIGAFLEDLIIPPKVRDMTLEKIQNWLDADDAIPSGEIDLLNKKLEPLQVYANHVMTTNSHGKEEMFCICVNLTNRRQVEAENKRLLMAIEQSADAIVITDTDGIIEYVNPSFNKPQDINARKSLGIIQVY